MDNSQKLIFYLHPNENPSQILVQPPLDGTNYQYWSRAMRLALRCKHKLHFVDGTVEIPDKSDRQFELYEQCNDMVKSWLLNSVTPTIARSILCFKTAAAIWTDLRERFSQGDLFRLTDVIEEIHALKQGNLSVNDYFTNLKALWDEMLYLRPLPTCTCESSNSMKFFFDGDYVLRFVKGLNDSFSQLKTQVLLTHPLPPINHVFSLAMKAEQQHNPSSALTSSTDHPLLNTTGKGVVNVQANSGFCRNNLQSNSKRLQCSYCGRKGHTVDRCYKKHGYPVGFKFKPHDKNVMHSGSFQANSITGSAAFTSTNPIDGKADLIQHEKEEMVVGLTQIQYQQLLALFQKNSIGDGGAIQPAAVSNQASVMTAHFHSPQVSGPNHEELDWSRPSL